MPMVDIFLVAGSEMAAAGAEGVSALTASEIAAEEAGQAILAQQAAQQAAQQGLSSEAINQQLYENARRGITQAAQPLPPATALPPAGSPPITYDPEQYNQIVEAVKNSQNNTFTPMGNSYAQAPGTMSDAGSIPQTLNQTSVDQVGRGIGNKATELGYGNASSSFNPNSLQSLNPGAPSPDIVSTANGTGSLNSYNGSQLTSDVLKPQPSDLKNGWDSITGWMKENPMTSAIGAYGILNASGALKPQNTSFNAEPYNGPLSKYHLSPNFQTYPQGPNTNIYQPHYAAEGGIMQAGGPVAQMSDNNVFGNNLNYPGSQNTGIGNSNDVATNPYSGQQQMAGGGIVAFSPGGDVSSMYSKMLENPTSVPYSRPDVGIVSDSNPNTRNLNASDAALYYQKVLANRYGIHTPANLPTGAMGKINTVPVMAKKTKGAADDVEAAAGGIMQAQHYNLGGYAHGGNPRLLRGPGDGMSDNIPATIADTQPARLADGEFVVPADVVSGLGNGSTEAGAKHLHKMMDEIRMARTGTKKQGKQINPNKFVPT